MCGPLGCPLRFAQLAGPSSAQLAGPADAPGSPPPLDDCASPQQADVLRAAGLRTAMLAEGRCYPHTAPGPLDGEKGEEGDKQARGGTGNGANKGKKRVKLQLVEKVDEDRGDAAGPSTEAEEATDGRGTRTKRSRTTLITTTPGSGRDDGSDSGGRRGAPPLQGRIVFNGPQARAWWEVLVSCHDVVVATPGEVLHVMVRSLVPPAAIPLLVGVCVGRRVVRPVVAARQLADVMAAVPCGGSACRLGRG